MRVLFACAVAAQRPGQYNVWANTTSGPTQRLSQHNARAKEGMIGLNGNAPIGAD